MYRIFNISIDSDIPLPELDEISDISTVISVRAACQDSVSESSIDWRYEWRGENNTVCISFGRFDGKYLLRFPGLADFLISLESKTISYIPLPDVPQNTLRHLLLDQVVPRMLGQLSHLVLHASAVMLSNGKGIAIIGDSGWGKSTLASSFLDDGAQLITDDCLLIERQDDELVGIGGYYGLRLFDDSVNAVFSKFHETVQVSHYSRKKRLVLDQSLGKRLSHLPLDAIFFLGKPDDRYRSDEVIIESLSGTSAIMRIIKQMFLLDPVEKELISHQFRNVGDALNIGTPVYQLHYPRDHAVLLRVRQVIESKVTGDRFRSERKFV